MVDSASIHSHNVMMKIHTQVTALKIEYAKVHRVDRIFWEDDE